MVPVPAKQGMWPAAFSLPPWGTGREGKGNAPKNVRDFCRRVI